VPMDRGGASSVSYVLYLDMGSGSPPLGTHIMRGLSQRGNSTVV
jgi:hypothetical protein